MSGLANIHTYILTHWCRNFKYQMRKRFGFFFPEALLYKVSSFVLRGFCASCSPSHPTRAPDWFASFQSCSAAGRWLNGGPFAASCGKLNHSVQAPSHRRVATYASIVSVWSLNGGAIISSLKQIYISCIWRSICHITRCILWDVMFRIFMLSKVYLPLTITFQWEKSVFYGELWGQAFSMPLRMLDCCLFRMYFQIPRL